MEDNINTKNKEERDWEKTGIKVLDMAKQELFLGMRYIFLASKLPFLYSLMRRISSSSLNGFGNDTLPIPLKNTPKPSTS